MKKEIMTIAHTITKETVKVYGCNYAATLSIVLKQIYTAVKSARRISDIEMEIKYYRTKTMGELARVNASSVEVAAGIVEMHYSEYKNKYNSCKTVDGSYDKKAKTIKVYTMATPVTQKATHAHVNANTELCPICGTYCYGDCRVNRAI